MIPMIQQAVTMGYTAVQILKFVSSKFKSAQPGISSARQQGYSDEDILKFIGGKIKPKNKKNADDQLSAQEQYLKASGVKTKEERKETRDKFLAGAIGLGATALGAYNMYQNYGGMLQGLGQTFGQGGTAPQPGSPPQVPQGPQPTPAAMPTAPIPQTPPPAPPQPIQPGPNIGQQLGQQVQQPIENAMQPAAPNQVAQAAQAIPQPQQPPASIFSQLMGGVDPNTLDPEKQKQLQFLSMISDQLQSKGKGLADPEFQKLAEKVKGIVKGKPGMAIQEGTRFKEAYPETPGQIVPEKAVPEQVKEVKQPIAKGSSVITPSGDIATIEDLPGKTARVDVDGKQQVHNTDDLIPVPDNSDEIGDLYQKLIDKIPEGHKSRVYDAIGYDPVRNAIKYTYHDGKSYIIDDVPEEIAKEIANSGFLAKTTGGNYMGFYYQGNPSIGAGMHVLISDLQKLRGGKGKEYSYKFEELYSQHRLPKQILKERFDKEKLREREEKKKAKKK